jgi:hypothetical protein
MEGREASCRLKLLGFMEEMMKNNIYCIELKYDSYDVFSVFLLTSNSSETPIKKPPQ